MYCVALIITIVVNNSPDPHSKQMKMAMAWEAEYIKFMKNFSHPNMTISWNSEARCSLLILILILIVLYACEYYSS